MLSQSNAIGWGWGDGRRSVQALPAAVAKPTLRRPAKSKAVSTPKKPPEPLTPAQQALVTANMGLAFYVVDTVMKVPEAHRDDALCVAEDVLMRASRKWRPEQSKFSTYACRAIILRLYSEYGRRQKRNARFVNITDYDHKPKGMDKSKGAGGGLFADIETSEKLPSKEQTHAGRHVVQAEMVDSVENCLRLLDPRIQDIVRSRFGIGRPAETADQIGRRLKLTRDYIMVLERDALRLMAKVNIEWWKGDGQASILEQREPGRE